LQQFLFVICNQVNKIGGHVFEKSVLQSLVLGMSDMIFQIYNSFLEKKMDHCNKEGIVQLIFDIRFVFEVFGWRKELNSAKDIKILKETNLSLLKGQDSISQSSQVDDVLTWNSKIENLIQSYEKKMDPIDVIFYQKYLKENAKSSFQRSVILFGVFGNLQSTQKIPENKSSSLVTSHNTLMLAKTTNRFTLLPISTPFQKPKEQVFADLNNKNLSTKNQLDFQMYSICFVDRFIHSNF